MKPDTYVIKKELGSGTWGTTYKILIGKNEFALKRIKIYSNEIKKNTKYIIWRELDFFDWIGKLDKNQQIFFAKMYDHNIYKCDFKYKINKNTSQELVGVYTKLNKSPYCLDIVLDLKDGTLGHLIEKDKLDEKQYLNFTIEILYCIILMRSSGYVHQDIHSYNICYQKVCTDKNIIINFDSEKYSFKSRGFVFSLIDYGIVMNDRFTLSAKERKIYNSKFTNNNDLVQLINILIKRDIIMSLSKSYSIINFLGFIKSYVSSKPHLWNKVKIITDYVIKTNDNRKLISAIENNKPITKSLWIKTHHGVYLMECLVLLYSRKQYFKFLGINKDVPPLINWKCVEFMIINYNDMPKILKYLVEIVNSNRGKNLIYRVEACSLLADNLPLDNERL